MPSAQLQGFFAPNHGAGTHSRGEKLTPSPTATSKSSHRQSPSTQPRLPGNLYSISCSERFHSWAGYKDLSELQRKRRSPDRSQGPSCSGGEGNGELWASRHHSRQARDRSPAMPPRADSPSLKSDRPKNQLFQPQNSTPATSPRAGEPGGADRRSWSEPQSLRQGSRCLPRSRRACSHAGVSGPARISGTESICVTAWRRLSLARRGTNHSNVRNLEAEIHAAVATPY